MPLYEYECGKCGHRFEKIRKFSDPPLKKCPECRGRLRKLPSAPAIQFKGQGWYITDYARKGKAEAEGTEGKEGKGKDEKPEAKKPAEEKASAEARSKKAAEGGGKSSRKKSSDD